MVISIDLSPDTEQSLRKRALLANCPVEEVARQILEQSSDDEGDPAEEVRATVAAIKALGPNPGSLRPATASLADYLRNSPSDPNFDLAKWTRDWEKAELEMKRLERLEGSHIAEE